MSEDQNAEAPKPEAPKRVRFTPPQPTDAEIEALDVKHDDVLVMRGGAMDPWCVVVRRPTRTESSMYKLAGKREANGGMSANEQLIRKIAVFPDANTLGRMIDRWTFIPDGITSSEKFKDFVGAGADADLKG